MVDLESGRWNYPRRGPGQNSKKSTQKSTLTVERSGRRVRSRVIVNGSHLVRVVRLGRDAGLGWVGSSLGLGSWHKGMDWVRLKVNELGLGKWVCGLGRIQIRFGLGLKLRIRSTSDLSKKKTGLLAGKRKEGGRETSSTSIGVKSTLFSMI